MSGSSFERLSCVTHGAEVWISGGNKKGQAKPDPLVVVMIRGVLRFRRQPLPLQRLLLLPPLSLRLLFPLWRLSRPKLLQGG